MKGISFTIAAAVGVLLMGVTVSGITFLVTGGGPLGQAIDSASDKIVDQTASDGPVRKVSSKQELAGMAILTMDRAAECTWVKANRPYNSLENTQLGKNPQCRILPFGGTIRTIRDRSGGVGDAVTGSGNDVEGIDGRIRFKVTEDIIIDVGESLYTRKTEDIPLSRWGSPADFSVTAVSRTPYSQNVKSKCGLGGFRTSRYDQARNSDASYGFILAFRNPSNFNQRYNPSERKLIDRKIRESKYGGIYCSKAAGDGGRTDSLAHDYSAANSEALGKIKLCDGDTGYIQTNKKQPTSEAESKDTGENLGATSLFGYIQIQETADNCRINDPIQPILEHSNDFNTASNVLRIDANADKYPDLNTVNKNDGFDLVKGTMGRSNIKKLRNNLADTECGLSLVERQPKASGGNVKKRWLKFERGTTVPRTGKITFPPKGNEEVEIQRGKSGFTGPAQNLYNKLRTTGLTGERLNNQENGISKSDLILQRRSGHYFELYGPLKCGSSNPGNQDSKWHLCITKAPGDKPVTLNKKISTDQDSKFEYKCTLENGWKNINDVSRFSKQDLPDSIDQPSLLDGPSGTYRTEDKDLIINPSIDQTFCDPSSKTCDKKQEQADGLRYSRRKIPDGSKKVTIRFVPVDPISFRIRSQKQKSKELFGANRASFSIQSFQDNQEYKIGFGATGRDGEPPIKSLPIGEETTIEIEINRNKQDIISMNGDRVIRQNSLKMNQISLVFLRQENGPFKLREFTIQDQ